MSQPVLLPADTPPTEVDAWSIADRISSIRREQCRLEFEQYDLAAQLLAERVTERIAAGLPQDRWEVGIAGEIALALRISSNRARGVLARARELRTNLPHTLALLRDGDLSPDAVPVIVQGVAHLDPDLRCRADEILCGDPHILAGLGLGRLHDKVQQVAYELDREGTVEHLASAPKDRRVTIRPVPDLMTRISLLLPMAQGVGVYSALRKAAVAIKGVAGETRTLTQIMADLAYERLTGRAVADGQDVTVNLTVPATVLLCDRPGVAHLAGGGALPAEIARKIVGVATAKGRAWVKRLYVRPESGAVVGLDSRARRFPEGLAELIAARDQYCRTPYCDAPIIHTDHVHRHASGGGTDYENGQGLCAACNYAKEGAGWRSRSVEDPSGRHTVETQTPSGHVYRSTAPGHAA
ncbi:HNH endonuclease signature motif containing protein [Tsukamurella sp. PLM1]|uniref:HNH endonuclease n=1 Tax=Tsukamurella sp. PLM1 TaxID=2929795 RepID=UPI00206A53A9|nr:HNH endonuclease signature motif containing protein [Tsukamurella sp. PLM1]BDH57838.1 HNH endonuclease [Tsukamurella sp. PLM1]